MSAEAIGSKEGTESIHDLDAVHWDGEYSPRVLAASEIEGREVQNNDDQTLGKIAHVMLEMHTGRIAYAVLSVGGFLGMGDKLVAVPWRALSYEAEADCFRLDMTKELMAQADSFDEDEWPSMGEQTWADDLHDFYGARPYWR